MEVKVCTHWEYDNVICAFYKVFGSKLTLLKYLQWKTQREYLQDLLLLRVLSCMNVKQFKEVSENGRGNPKQKCSTAKIKMTLGGLYSLASPLNFHNFVISSIYVTVES